MSNKIRKYTTIFIHSRLFKKIPLNIVFAIVFSLLIIFIPLYSNGYIFALDMIFTPHLTTPQYVTSEFIGSLFLYLINIVIPSDIIQKIILTSSISLMIISAYFLFNKIICTNNANKIITSAIIYVFNPFVYSRFMTGQYLFLLSYAIIPFYVIALINFLVSLSWRHALSILLWSIIISVVSFHTLGLLLVISIPLIGLYVYKNWGSWGWYKSFALKGFSIVAVFILASSYWLIPVLSGRGKIAEIIDSFGTSDFTAFATNGNTLGTIGNVITMQGFWADSTNLYLIPQDIYWWWFIPLCILGMFIITGIYKSWHAMRGLTIAFLIMLGIAIVLATGTSGSTFAPINQWLVTYIPFFSGYREPQKFVAIIVLTYSVFGALGVQQIIEWLRSRKYTHHIIQGFRIGTFILPIACAPLMLWGFNGQLHTSDYPKDWYSIDNYLKAVVSENEKVLALPWHMYMRFEFAERVIANPMDKFFTSHLIVNNDPEYKGAHSHSATYEQQAINNILQEKSLIKGKEIVNKLKTLHINYILVAKEFDYQKYKYLENQDDILILKDTKNLRLYKIGPDSME